MEIDFTKKVQELLKEDNTEFSATKNQYLPKYLAKYRAPTAQALESFKNDTMWFDFPVNYNDPYDCSITISGRIIDEAISQRISNIGIFDDDTPIPDESQFHLDNFFRSGIINNINTFVQKSCLISCFSTNWSSMLMWSHYGSSHKGFCTLYDISQLDAGNMIRKNLYPVIYSDKKFDISYYLDDLLTPKYPFIASLCWKNVAWSYEDEYRIILPNSSSGPHLIDFIKPSAIFLGAKMDKGYEDTITNIALDRKIKVYNMECSSQKFELEARELIWKRRD